MCTEKHANLVSSITPTNNTQDITMLNQNMRIINAMVTMGIFIMLLLVALWTRD